MGKPVGIEFYERLATARRRVPQPQGAGRRAAAGGAGQFAGARGEAAAARARSVPTEAQCRTRPRQTRPTRSRAPPPLPPCRTTRPLGASRGPRARPASLLLLAAWLAAAGADLACPQEQPSCASCRSYGDVREHSLRVIRESLLAKLGFSQAPNTTGRELPHVPDDLMMRFHRSQPGPGVQADAPRGPARTVVSHTERDDFLARTDNVLVFALMDISCHCITGGSVADTWSAESANTAAEPA